MEPTNKNPCGDYLSDRDYLLHMIPHHQVAIDISLKLQKKSKTPWMQSLLRELVWVQGREIAIMKDFLSLPDSVSNDMEKMNKVYVKTLAEFTEGTEDPNAECLPEFFDPELHNHHMEHMELSDKMYIDHMIPHHQVAIDMSKRLLMHTNNAFMIGFAYRIIRSQQKEIFMMNNMLKSNTFNWNSNILA